MAHCEKLLSMKAVQSRVPFFRIYLAVAASALKSFRQDGSISLI